jgi:hypothetical protein
MRPTGMRKAHGAPLVAVLSLGAALTACSGQAAQTQVVSALLRAHHRASFLSLLWTRLRYRPNAGEEGLAARRYLATRSESGERR